MDVASDPGAGDLVPGQVSLYWEAKAGLPARIAKQRPEMSDPAVALEWARGQQPPNTGLQILHGLADGVAEPNAHRHKQDQPANPTDKPKSARKRPANQIPWMSRVKR
ncbi:MAG: hypothetical protein ACLQIB_08010 [Isosphaeraceae bacterium]